MKNLIMIISFLSVFLIGVLVGRNPFFTRKKPLMYSKNIHTAAAAGDFEGTKRFLDAGVSANALDDYLQTPLLHATWWGHLGVVQLLIEHGVDVNLQNSEGFTGLYWAINHGYYSVAEALLKAGASPNVHSLNDWTSLHEAAVHGDDLLYDLLLKYGADENAKDRWGKTPRDLREARKK